MHFYKEKRFYILLSVLLFSLVYFLPLIIKLPDYLMDDFLMFSIINKNPSGFIMLNPGDMIHMLVRPLTFFSFWFDCIVLKSSSLHMKIGTLLLHFCFISVFFVFTCDLLKYLKFNIYVYKLGIITLIISVHTISMWWIILIGLRNELMMILFYTISLYSVFLFIKTGKNYFLVISLIFYIFSFLSKQQSLHLPLIVLIILIFFKNNFEKEIRLKLLYFVSTALIFMVIFLIINGHYYESSTNLLSFSGLWKKPLSALSSIGLALFPFETDILYNYLIVHVLTAIIIFSVLTGVILFLFAGNLYSRKILLCTGLIFIISFFPVLAAEITLRIISIQVFLVYLFLALFVHKIKIKNYIVYPALILILCLNIHASLKQFFDEESLNNKRKDCIVKLDDFIKTSGGENKILITSSPFGLYIPYQYYYYKNNAFGKDSLTDAPFGWTYYFKNFYAKEIRNTGEILMNTRLKDSTIILEPAKDYIKLFTDNTKNFKIIKQTKDNLKGYTEIEFIAPDIYRDYTKIYYNGTEWGKLK